MLRREYLERPWDPDHLPAPLAARLRSRETLARRVRRLKDERLRLMALYPSLAEGHDPRDVPAWVGVTSYVEQRFGAWTVTGGMGVLAEALSARLATRKVDVHTASEVRDLVLRDGRVVAVDTAAGELDADLVVVAVRPPPAAGAGPSRAADHAGPARRSCATSASRATSRRSPTRPCCTAARRSPPSRCAPGGRTPATLTVARARSLDEDLLAALVRRGVDVRPQVVTRVDRSPRDLVEQWGGSPLGVLWQGRQTAFRRLGPATPVPGVYAVGAHATPGAGLPFVGLSAALVAQLVGPA